MNDAFDFLYTDYFPLTNVAYITDSFDKYQENNRSMFCIFLYNTNTHGNISQWTKFMDLMMEINTHVEKVIINLTTNNLLKIISLITIPIEIEVSYHRQVSVVPE